MLCLPSLPFAGRLQGAGGQAGGGGPEEAGSAAPADCAGRASAGLGGRGGRDRGSLWQWAAWQNTFRLQATGGATVEVYDSPAPQLLPWLAPAPHPCSKAGEVESLEARRRAMEGGMRERRAEVEVQLELMQVGGWSGARDMQPGLSTGDAVDGSAAVPEMTPSTACAACRPLPRPQNEARLLRDEVHRVTLELQVCRCQGWQAEEVEPMQLCRIESRVLHIIVHIFMFTADLPHVCCRPAGPPAGTV